MSKNTQISVETNVWDNEYDVAKVIPSSIRELPSKALVLYHQLINFDRFNYVLDAGCGNGRNAIYLAKNGCKVDAVDSSSAALSIASKRIKNAGCDEKVKLIRKSLFGEWPFRDGQFDFSVDSYVSCHFLVNGVREKYHQELCRVTRKNGLIFSSVFCTDDQYYAELANGQQRVKDPRNDVSKYLYTESEFRTSFEKHLEVVFLTKFQFVDEVIGRSFLRSVLALVGKR